MLIKTPIEMQKFWEEISKKYSKFLLYWDLWAWKTHFVKGVVFWLWISPDIVQSPTYTYLNIYENKLLHMDLYRLENEQDFIEKWILNQIDLYDHIAIEWPRFENLYVDNNWLKIYITKIDENTREISYTS